MTTAFDGVEPWSAEHPRLYGVFRDFYRSEYVRRLYAPVAIGIEKLKRPSVEAKAIVRGGKHRP